MAELGNVFSLFNKDTPPETPVIDVEMLDYGFVSECNDINKLNGILAMLRSGKEGFYPDLVKFTEEKFVSLLSPRDRKRYLTLTQEASVSEVFNAEQDILVWQQKLCGQTNGDKLKLKLPPVRGSVVDTNVLDDTDQNINFVESPDELYYKTLSTNQNLKLAQIRKKLNVSSLSELSRKSKAKKIKGNESFRLGENESAVSCYSTSLALDDSVAAVWANRAMAYIRMELFDLAEQDCSRALQLDESYAKALSRRGLVRFKRGKYAEAALDFRASLLIDPGNQELLKLLRSAESKYLEVEGVSLHAESAPNQAYVIEFLEVSECVELELPTALGDTHLFVSGVMSTFDVSEGEIEVNNGDASFVRIPITFDSESDSEGEEADSSEKFDTTIDNGAELSEFRRIVVEEEEEEEEDEVVVKVKAVVKTEDPESSIEQSNLSATPPMDSRYNHDRYTVAHTASEFKEAGNSFLKAGKLEEALSAYSASLECDPLYLPALNNRAQAYLSLKDYAAAVEDCSRVLFQESGNLKALYRRAIAFHAAGNLKDAMTDVKKLLKIDPHNTQALKLCEKFGVNYQQLFLNNGSDKAEKSFTKAVFGAHLNRQDVNSADVNRPSESNLDEDMLVFPPVNSVTATRDVTRISAEKHSLSLTPPRPPPVAAAVPSVPPKNSYELERVWRALKDRPSGFAKYLALFKKTTFRRVVIEAVSPEIISSIFVALHREHTPNLIARLNLLESFSGINSFAFTLSLLPSEDLASISEVFAEVALDAHESMDVQRVRKMELLYSMCKK